jgi:hypothetical protein
MFNQLENLEGRLFLSASVSNGTLTITGSEGADRIVITANKKNILVREGSHQSRFGKADHITNLVVNSLGGNDRVKITGKLAATVNGGDGNDLIQGGAGDDVLVGGNGNDRIFGNGGKDSITGGAGRDVMFGGAGDDMFDAYDTEADKLTGGAGNDQALVDTGTDTAWNIEGYQSIQPPEAGGPLDVSTSGLWMDAGNSTYVYTGNINVPDNGTGSLTLGGVQTDNGLLTVNFGAFSNATLSGSGSPLDGLVDSFHPATGIATGEDGSILIRTTPVGDLNLDGSVTIEDFINLSSHFNTNPEPITQPIETNSDASVVIQDFVDLAAAFNSAPVASDPATSS